MTAAAPLTGDDVARLLEADANVRAAKAALESARAARDEVRAELAPAAPYGHAVRAPGFEVLRRRKSTGERVNLKAYRARYALSKRLAAYIEQSFYDDWQIRPVERKEA